MKKSKLSYVVLIFGLLIPVLGAAAPFSNIYVLGDSLSDQGNLYAATLATAGTGLPANDHYYQGRFSNGPIYVDLLAQKLGLPPLTPSIGGGNNFAYGGARTDYSVFDANAPTPPGPGPYPAPPEAFPWSLKGEQKAFNDRIKTLNIKDPNGLYIVWSGSNDLADLIDLAANGQDVSAQLKNAVDGIQSVINDFITIAGARNILVPNIPDLGLVPIVLSNGTFVAGVATSLASTYNTLLNAMLDTFVGVNIDRVDVFSLMQQVAANPAMYGFTNVTTACYSGFVAPANPPNSVTVCSNPPFNENPSSYAFWDSYHPTTAFHELLANRFYQAVVPEPSVLMNFLLGLGVLAAVERTRLLRRRRAVECVS